MSMEKKDSKEDLKKKIVKDEVQKRELYPKREKKEDLEQSKSYRAH
jgi:hypothetical protein